MIGEILGNRYEILEEIGQGGMALVYKAKCLKLNRLVAVKILRPQFACDEEFVGRFQREAEAAASLAHPNVVSIYDVGQDSNLYYMVMEYVDENNLKELIRQRAPFSCEEAITITQQICNALEAAHKQGIIHRDIKPHNILIAHDGRVKVTDFGIARAKTASNVTEIGVVMGSVHYFSPEQAKAGQVDSKSDLYSLGIILYEMMTGKVPFEGENPVSIALKHLQEEPVLPSEINSAVSPCLEKVILKLLEKNPAQRFTNAADVRKSLQNCLVMLDDFANKTVVLKKDDLSATKIISAQDWQKKEQEKPKKKISPWAYAIPLILLITLLTWGAASYFSVPDVNCPDFTGKNLQQAEILAKENALSVNVISRAYSEEVPVDYVVSQFPEANKKVKKGRTINLVISKGPELKRIPDVTNKSLQEASIILGQEELLMGNKIEEYSVNVPKGYVVNQMPAAGGEIKKGSKVDLIISKGQEPAWLKIPDFIGEKLEDTKKKLEQLGLQLGSIKEQDTIDAEPGSIISQAPDSGTEVQQGSKVELIISKIQKAKKNQNITVIVPPGPDKQEVKIVVKDNNGQKVIYNALNSPGDRIEKNVQGDGIVNVQIYIAGDLFEEKTF